MTDRLDVTLFRRGLAASREKAKAAVAAGIVRVNGVAAAKPSMPVGEDDAVELAGETLRYVGRGGLKLERALEEFSLSVADARCVDIGASTGGFTDCLLQHGAASVVAVDVGHDQLHSSLRSDARVTCMEGTDARAVTVEQLGGHFDVAVTDVSFISLSHILPVMARLLREGGYAVCLIKPQFEAGREHVGKRGVVKDRAVHHAVITRVLEDARAAGLSPVGLSHSPVTGGDGNIEYLLCAVRAGAASGGGTSCPGVEKAQDRDVAAAFAPDVSVIVARAHEELARR